MVQARDPEEAIGGETEIRTKVPDFERGIKRGKYCTFLEKSSPESPTSLWIVCNESITLKTFLRGLCPKTNSHRLTSPFKYTYQQSGWWGGGGGVDSV